ncbi:DUF2147 domain-containing protein [Nemorincola caseinilytica]|uniref:DUF2147 domain-containing protein n=1 Tax=Nemorincola caseinilytica TaxID=2054315 RepID=A0ABP8NRQ2_9BACT
MSANYFFRASMLCVCLLAGRTMAFAQDQIERLWYNEEKTAKIQVFKATDGKFYGKIIWLKEPNNEQGKPKVDKNNPKKERQNDPVLGLQILKGFVKDGATGYEDGTIYDPKNGKTYSCKITYKGNSLDVRGYVGISLLGRTTTWTKAE